MTDQGGANDGRSHGTTDSSGRNGIDGTHSDRGQAATSGAESRERPGLSESSRKLLEDLQHQRAISTIPDASNENRGIDGESSTEQRPAKRSQRSIGGNHRKTTGSNDSFGGSDSQVQIEVEPPPEKPIGLTGGKEKIANTENLIKLEIPKKGKPLSEKEAKELYPRTVRVFTLIFKYADEFISATNRDLAEAMIWRRIDEEDIEVIVELIMDGAKKVAIIAEGVRKINQAYRYLAVGAVTLPKFFETYKFYLKHGGFAFMPELEKGESAQ